MTPNTRLGRLERKMGMDADNCRACWLRDHKSIGVPSPIVVAGGEPNPPAHRCPECGNALPTIILVR